MSAIEMNTMEIKVITYEEERLEYFKTLRDRMQSRYERWKKIVDSKEPLPYISEDLEMLSDLGREISFYNDVINMFEENIKQKSEIERLKKGLEAQNGGIKYLRETNEALKNKIKVLRVDTIKKFAERLKEYKIKPEFPWDDFYITDKTIDDVVKEMTRKRDCRDCEYFVGCECFGTSCCDLTEEE